MHPAASGLHALRRRSRWRLCLPIDAQFAGGGGMV
jgi:hypothetical protein